MEGLKKATKTADVPADILKGYLRNISLRDLPLRQPNWQTNITFFFVGWDLRHQVLRPLLAYCTAPDDR
jgi:hypothetical protein